MMRPGVFRVRQTLAIKSAAALEAGAGQGFISNHSACAAENEGLEGTARIDVLGDAVRELIFL